MPPCPETVLEASQMSRPGWENRLTAIFATVLDQHPALAGALFDFVGLPRGEWYEANIEEWVTPLRRVDLEVIAVDDAGIVSRLWSENKRHGGKFSTGQREDYLAALDGRSEAPGRLVTIVDTVRDEDEDEDEVDGADADDADDGAPASDSDDGDAQDDDLPAVPGEPSPAEPRWISLTWQVVAELADTVGRATPEPWGGSDWRERAVKSDAPAKHRALYELVWYLEEEGYAVLHPFDAGHADALAHREATDAAACALLERVAEAPAMGPLTPVKDPYDHGSGFGQELTMPAASWAMRLDGYIEVGIWGHDDWSDQPTGAPSIGVGLYFDARWYAGLNERRDWIAHIRSHGFSFVEWDEYVFCYAAMKVEDLIRDGGVTLPEQAHYVAAWAAPLLKLLLSDECDPGHVADAVKPKRGRSRRES
jgi:hypothetical protein